MSPQKKKILLLFIALSVILGVIVYLKYSAGKNIENSFQKLTPTPLVPTPTLFLTTTLTPFLSPTLTLKLKLIKLMPVITKDYTIEYLPAPKKFVVMILKEPFNETVKIVEDWFFFQGVDPKDPDIYWWDSNNRQ